MVIDADFWLIWSLAFAIKSTNIIIWSARVDYEDLEFRYLFFVILGQVFISLGFDVSLETDTIISIPWLCFKNKEALGAGEEASGFLSPPKGK